MEVRKPKIKSMKYEDFTDNEYLEKMIEELRANGTNVVMGCLDEVINWGRSNSLWPLTFATSCCGIEFMAVGAARYDFCLLYTSGSASKHEVTLALMSQFRSVNMRFEELDLTYLREFEIFLRQRGNVNNSLATKFSVLKAVYNKAVSEGVFVPKLNPFQQFKVGSLWTNTRKRAITKEDIHKLIELDLSDRDFYTQLAKDIFLFSYFMAGINFKDIALLTYGDIDNGRIYYARRKTGKMMNCCLTEQAQEIIDKYHTDQVEEDYLFPILDRQIHTTEKQILERVKKTLKHVNKRLHELSEEIGLHTPLTTYTARHTYATVLKRSGVSVALISESLGHSDLSTTQIYLDSFENSQIDAAMQHLL